MDSNKNPQAEWMYFGCYRQPGHYLFRHGMQGVYINEFRKLTSFDGLLPPQDSAVGYVATLSRLGGYGLTALAFWDYTVDKRSGCNSIFFAPSLTISAADLLAGAQERFPEVWARLPEIILHQSVLATPA